MTTRLIVRTMDGREADRRHGEVATDRTRGDLWKFGGWLGEQLVAVAGLESPNERQRSVELSYWTAPEHRGKGYATELCQCVLELVFLWLPVRFVWFQVLESNAVSHRVAVRLGAEREPVPIEMWDDGSGRMERGEVYRIYRPWEESK